MNFQIGSHRPKIMIHANKHGIAVVFFSWHRLYVCSIGLKSTSWGATIKKYAKKAN